MLISQLVTIGFLFCPLLSIIKLGDIMNKNSKKLFILLIILLFPLKVMGYSNRVVLGGQNVGISIQSDGVLVVGFYKINGTLNNSKLTVGDYITKVSNNDINTINDLVNAIDSNVKNNSVNLTFRHNGNIKNTDLKLEQVNGVYKTGLYVKDSLTGLGTLTYIDPETKIYGALGHEILESTANSRIEVKTGNIFKSVVTSITKSEDSAPGTKNAKFYKNVIYGTISKNVGAGIYGNYADSIDSDNLIPVENPGKVKLGEATIYTALDDNTVKSYQINILRVDPNNSIKNFYFEVTDKDLLEKAGGIVQGMSGSPIVQDGNLIGAVTHVSIDKVNTGYGISIITMLKSGEEK
jgi:stage IV sporulation protein B